jgi:hypothetical protein
VPAGKEEVLQGVCGRKCLANRYGADEDLPHDERSIASKLPIDEDLPTWIGRLPSSRLTPTTRAENKGDDKLPHIYD